MTHLATAPRSTTFPLLSRGITVGPLDLPHRIIMGSMHTGLEDRAEDFPQLARFYAERARGGAGLMITGGFSPNDAGRLTADGGRLANADDVQSHRLITEAVHRDGAKIAVQLLHAGRYAFHSGAVSASATHAPINRFPARELSSGEVTQTIADFVASARLALEAGYDAIEIMGSEGYLINQFLSGTTNLRDDEWGGDAERRRRFALEIVRGVREAVGDRLAVIFRLSVVDLVPGGQTAEEVLSLATELEAAGVDLINTGIGWHESRVPTIVTSVPRAAFADFTARITKTLTIPVAASNRITLPETAEQLLADGTATMVTMARPFLADPSWVSKTLTDRPETITPCIGCNQACLDHSFTGRTATCLVNPAAVREEEFTLRRTSTPGATLAVVGGGPAGMNAAITAAQRGFDVVLFEERHELGGQFRLARAIPGKEEFAEALRYFHVMLERLNVDVRRGHRAKADELAEFDHVILATGVRPRALEIPGADAPRVHSYDAVIRGEVTCGSSVAIIGAGGIGFDVAEFLIHDHGSVQRPAPVPSADELQEWFNAWGVDSTFSTPGGVTMPAPRPAGRTIHMLQRKTTKMGIGLAPTSGWVHRAVVKGADVQFHTGVVYEKISEHGLHVTIDGEPHVLDVDDIVVCAGQESVRDLEDDLNARGVVPQVVGGANIAAELDAKRAIEEATRAIIDLD
ncbi:FAD-dependent oxidoreductase [Citricoccus muralis]|uniref:FAD-dependent oxidoreductase n=1 Tax=Citricoccus muralis TaxID=169134 RepID=A0ABY8H2L2_9MICC|nr:NADPH-dependent 2,4-dienoyl-CoA reductase [Citricoccus muralis]WFP15364.1 FAD-dependent oxidoreductase [Citricoccus muralis]